MQFIPAFITSYSNSDFTNPHEVVLPDEPKDCTADFTHMGVKYWGLETKRHKATSIDTVNNKIYYNHEEHHSVELEFKHRASISNVKISTKWFTGNQVQSISVFLIDKLLNEEKEILCRITLEPDKNHTFTFPPTTATQCRIHLFYEGGISCINFFGEPTKEQLPIQKNLLETASISHVSNSHYGHPKMAVNGCRKEMHMVGWESARTGFGEQAIFHLEQVTSIQEIVVDTYLHRLNPPLTCHVFGLLIQDGKSLEDYIDSQPKWMLQFEDGHQVIPENFQSYMLIHSYLKEPTKNPTQFEILLSKPSEGNWKEVLPHENLQADTYHRFTELKSKGPFSHLLYMHFPNGGIHGLKVY